MIVGDHQSGVVCSHQGRNTFQEVDRGDAEIAAGGMNLKQRDPVSGVPERDGLIPVDATVRTRASKYVGVGHV
jgi:hypothetical protein